MKFHFILNPRSNKDESIKRELLFICPYCHIFSSTLEREYQRHIVIETPR
jgi:hypothetical protein